MSATSPTLLERLSFSRNRSPLLPLRSPPRRKPSEYDLAELSPRPDDALLSPTSASSSPPVTSRDPVQASRAANSMSRNRRSASPGRSLDLTREARGPSSWGAPSPRADMGRQRHRDSPGRRVLFVGPPPPIAASMLVDGGPDTHSESSSEARAMTSSPRRLPGIIPPGILDLSTRLPSRERRSSPAAAAANADTTWRVLRRREQALERELQDLLDQQAAGLLAGGGGGDADSNATPGSDGDVLSQAGSSTPTGTETFYSTATSRSRMVASTLEQPARSTPQGDVIPVRQPRPATKSASGGLRSARRGLARTMAALAELKSDEDAQVSQALAQRRRALAHLGKLAGRKRDIAAELAALEGDREEPLGRELRELRAEHETLGGEIRELEERLGAMRNRHRFLERRMADVANRRDAGLSGYRGALREVESEMEELMRRPPVRPLDVDALQPRNGGDEGKTETEAEAGGAEFVRLIPERRTAELARLWWEGEVALLERRRRDVLRERAALDVGQEAWAEAVRVVTGFEAELRRTMRGEGVAVMGGDRETSLREGIRRLLGRMKTVVGELKALMHSAEEKQWNLLICAIGAELEALVAGEELLADMLRGMEAEASEGDLLGADGEMSNAGGNGAHEHEHGQEPESDNEVPADLLVSTARGDEDTLDAHVDTDAPGGRRVQRAESSGSENEVPPEFLREASRESDGVD